jgi:hypothetical protein
MIESEINAIPQRSHEEVSETIMQMEKNNSPEPDGFQTEFYRTCWSFNSTDLINMCVVFHKWEVPLFHLNFGTIILFPKKENVIQVQQYPSICILNVSIQIFTKVSTNRVTSIAHKVIRLTQTSFMLGRHILEGVVILHETIHELHKNDLDDVLLKMNFEPI